MKLNDVSRIFGRRTTLKYLMIGLAGSFVAACGGRSASLGTAGRATAPGGQARTPVAVAFANFVEGSWQGAVTTSYPDHAYKEPASLVVRPDSWSLLWHNRQASDDPNGDIMHIGTWSYESGHLTVGNSFDGAGNVNDSGAGVPGSIITGLFANVDWTHIQSWDNGTAHPDHSALQITYKDPSVKIVHNDRGTITTISFQPAVVRFDTKQRFQPVAPSPEATIRAVEAYADKAYATGDLSAMDNYFASRHDPLYKNAYDFIVTQNQVGESSSMITGLDLLSVTANKMVALITYRTTKNHQSPQLDSSKNTYSVIEGRWHLTDAAYIKPVGPTTSG